LGTLIWKSLNVCFQTDSKKDEGRDESKRCLPELRTGSQCLQEPCAGGCRVPAGGTRPCAHLVLDSASVAKEFLWRARIFSNDGTSCIKLREE